MSTQTELLARPLNFCRFSACEKYRYTLVHSWQMGPNFMPVEYVPGVKRIMWVGLNPSTANAQQLDNTLRRVRAFSHAWGFRSFVMTNLFAYRATQPRDMLLQHDPVGPENDQHLIAEAARSDMIIACWGTPGSQLGRDATVCRLINAPMFCLGTNANGSPRHPLYVVGTQKPIAYMP